MGRVARRVPLDFAWPLDQVWSGYVLPQHLRAKPCPDCAHGATDAFEWMQVIATCLAMLADDAADEQHGRPMHPYLTPLREVASRPGIGRPGPQFSELVDGLAPDAAGFSGRDVYRVARALVAAAGLPADWGHCPTCQGRARLEVYPGQRKDAEAWEPSDPPAGDGWQMWESTSEGSPISPVFATAEELAQWCAAHATTFGTDHRADVDGWLRIIAGEQAGVEIAPGVIAL